MNLNQQQPRRRPPLQDDCTRIRELLSSYGGTVITPPMKCHTTRYGTCMAFVCARCAEQHTQTSEWAYMHGVIQNFCVSHGEWGYADRFPGGNMEVGIKHSGDELPPYRC